jgi:hypothetical protein
MRDGKSFPILRNNTAFEALFFGKDSGGFWGNVEVSLIPFVGGASWA